MELTDIPDMGDLQWWVRFVWVPFVIAGMEFARRMFSGLARNVDSVKEHVDTTNETLRAEIRRETQAIHNRVDQVDRDLQAHKVEVARSYVQTVRLSEMEGRLTKRLDEINNGLQRVHELKADK